MLARELKTLPGQRLGCHHLRIRTDDGSTLQIALEPKPVADFYAEVMNALGALGIEAQMQARRNEIEPSIPFAEDREHASYDAEPAHLFWHRLVQADRVITRFRSHFLGQVSPVHFFWGAMDLAVPGSPLVRRPRTPAGRPTAGTG